MSNKYFKTTVEESIRKILNKEPKMTIEKIIQIFEYGVFWDYLSDYEEGSPGHSASLELQDAIEVVIPLLKKQIPKQPIVKIEKDYESNLCEDLYYCPVCSKIICYGVEGNLEENYPYCNCGQKLDWGDVKTNKQKRNWENAFQRWSNQESQDETNSMGMCGYGSICEYCKDNTHRSCIMALNAMCRDKHIVIDYSKQDFNKIWGGLF